MSIKCLLIKSLLIDPIFYWQKRLVGTCPLVATDRLVVDLSICAAESSEIHDVLVQDCSNQETIAYCQGRQGIIWSCRSTWRSCPCTSSLVAADEHFHRKEYGYKLEETAGSSQENMDLSDSRWYWTVIARLLGCPNTSWPKKRDATVWRLRADDDDDEGRQNYQLSQQCSSRQIRHDAGPKPEFCTLFF